jgi:hypothetical protein
MSAVLKRKLFMQAPVKKAKGGILSVVEEEDSYDDRTPENVEILTNNLRGDVRSMDERYDELAQMVGEEQAAQTPPEVIALLQTKLAPQQPMPPVPAAKANGIAGLMGGGQQGPQQPPMPGQPPMGGPQPPMPGQPPMPPGPPPTPTGEPPVQRQKGSDPLGELKERERKLLNQPYAPESGVGQVKGEGLRIDVGGVGDLPPVEIPPVQRIPEITAAEPPPRIPVTPTTIAPSTGGGRSGFAGTQPSQVPSALDVYNMENNVAAPSLPSADSFVDGYAKQGGDLNALAEYMAQPPQQFEASNRALADYAQNLANQQPTTQPAGQGIESMVNEPVAPALPQEDLSTIQDVANNFSQQPTPLTPETAPSPPQTPEVQAQTPASRPQPQQQTPAPQKPAGSSTNMADALSGAGLALLLGSLLSKGGGKISQGSDKGFGDYLGLLAFASPHRPPEGETQSDAYLDMFGKTPGEESSVGNMFEGLSSLPSAAKKSDVEVFSVKPSNIGVKSLAPQKPVERSKGSTRAGERIEPSFGEIKDVVGQNTSGIRANDPFNLPGRGVQPMPPVSDVYATTPKSRPLTLEELAERRRALVAGAEGPEIPARTQAEIAERVAAGERRTMSPATRTLYEMTRQMGIDPVVLTDRLNKFSNVMKKVPGVGKLFKGKEALKMLGADLAVGATATATGIGLLRSGEDGAPPPARRSQFGVEQIPTESDTTTGEPAPPAPPSPPGVDVPDVGGPVDLTPLTRESTPGSAGELDVTPIDTFEYDENILKEQQAAEQYAPGAEKDTSAAGLLKEEEDDYEKQVKKRAALYQKLLGDDPNDRQMKAYLLLAEAGLKMMTGKGRNTAEIIGGALQGLPSGFGAIASESSKIKRAATAAAISDINAQKLQETKSAASLATAMARAQAQQLPRNQKIMGNFKLLTENYGFPTDNPLTTQVATGLVDGTITTDKRGNLRGPTGEVIPRFGYGPANQPLKQDEAGFIPDNNPFLKGSPVKPSPIVDEKGMMDADEEIYRLQKSLGYLQAAKQELGNVIGPVNVLQRGISSVTQPILGDLGPFTAFQKSRANVVDRANRSIQEIIALNPQRVSVYEQEKNRKLEIDKNSFLNSPQIELARVLRFETELINEINKLKYRLNPEGGIKQMDVPSLGTNDDPLPTKAFSAIGEYFKSQPGAKVYWQDENGKVHELTKQYYESGMKR